MYIGKDNQLFKKNILDPNLKEIIVIYRILFRLLNQKAICDIEDDSEFWIKVCDFFNEKGIDKIGTFLVDSVTINSLGEDILFNCGDYNGVFIYSLRTPDGKRYEVNQEWMMTIAYYRGALDEYKNHPVIKKL